MFTSLTLVSVVYPGISGAGLARLELERRGAGDAVRCILWNIRVRIRVESRHTYLLIVDVRARVIAGYRRLRII